MLLPYYQEGLLEAGCDEAGRGCLAGSVFAAAVILPADYKNALLNDSKKLTEKQRDFLRCEIEKEALAWSVCEIDHETIDRVNILNASFMAMNGAVAQLPLNPELLLIDGNRFKNTSPAKHVCIVKGDGKYMSIAAASILAKTHRDEVMHTKHLEFPNYGWKKNKGYPTKEHRDAIRKFGITPYHRKTFQLLPELELSFLEA